jgi:hypothetical protein
VIPFKAEIHIIGANPYVALPAEILEEIFSQAGKNKGKIPVRMRMDGYEFVQTLVKYSGSWRLYLNTPMRKAANKEVGDTADFEIEFDPVQRPIPIHSKLTKALQDNDEAKRIFENIRPSLRLEIVRYISFMKTEAAIDKNVKKAINFLLGKERFIGRDKP